MLALKALSGTRKLLINTDTQGTESKYCLGTCSRSPDTPSQM